MSLKGSTREWDVQIERTLKNFFCHKVRQCCVIYSVIQTMPKDTFTDTLSQLLKDQEIDEGSCRNIRKNIFQHISESASKRREDALISSLKKVYKKPSKNTVLKNRNIVLSEIKTVNEKTLRSYELLHIGYSFLRKGVALSFSFALVAVTVLAPLQYSGYQTVIPEAKATYIECSGDVLLNGGACEENTIIEISAGDSIQTKERAKAVIFYKDYSVVRLEEMTQASLDSTNEEQIHISQGELWVNSPTENSNSSVKITTPVLKAKIPQGSAGVYSKRNTTELISDSALVEVQIDNPSGKTDVMTVSPELGVVKIRKGATVSNVRSFKLTNKQEDWVNKNRSEDKVHLAEVKKKTLEDHQLLAGVLPGGVPDYVGKLTQEAKSALTWNPSKKSENKLGQLDELFSETLVLLEKGDETTALTNFEAYHDKLTSLFVGEFDRLSVIESRELQGKVLHLLEMHLKVVSPYVEEDNEYILKEKIRELVLNLEIDPADHLAKKVKQSVAKAKVVEAHKNVTEGNIKRAEKLLLSASETLSEKNSINESLSLLSEISQKSSQLEPLVTEIKRKTLVQIKEQEIPNTDKMIETNIIKGSAYNKDTDEKEENDSPETVEIHSSLVIGQAIKENEKEL